MRDVYLGDGAYLSHDEMGQLWLAANDHNNRVVALEPPVYLRFIEESVFMMRCIYGEDFLAYLQRAVQKGAERPRP